MGGGQKPVCFDFASLKKKRDNRNLVWSVFLLSTCVLWSLGKEKCPHPVGRKSCCSSHPKSKPTKVDVGLHLPVGPFLLCRGSTWPAVQGGTGGSTLGPVHMPQAHHRCPFPFSWVHPCWLTGLLHNYVTLFKGCLSGSHILGQCISLLGLPRQNTTNWVT